jgi:hypothetical protein
MRRRGDIGGCLAGLIAAFLIVASRGWAATYTVAPTGVDTNPGTEERPWRTLSKAAATLAAGDTVTVNAGTYRERVVPERSGSPGRPIIYTAAAVGTVIIDGQGVRLPDDLTGLFCIQGRSHIVINGFRPINAGPYRDNAGIMVDQSSDIVIRSCSTADTVSSGIGVWSSVRVTVDQCRVEKAGSGGFQESITIAGTDGFTVSACTVGDCRKEGICLKDGSSNGTANANTVIGAHGVGIYVDAWDKHTHDITVFGNTVHDNDGNGIALASEMGGLLEKVSVHDNLSWHNRFLGIQISTNGDSPTHPMRDITVLNNTCVANGWDWGGGIALDNPDARSVIIRNNICSANRYFQLVNAPDMPREKALIDHNLIDGFQGTEGEILGESPVKGDPLFVDPSRADFHLRSGSPAIGAGSSDGAPPGDFEGRLRPSRGKAAGPCDIGAFQS